MYWIVKFELKTLKLLETWEIHLHFASKNKKPCDSGFDRTRGPVAS